MRGLGRGMVSVRYRKATSRAYMFTGRVFPDGIDPALDHQLFRHAPQRISVGNYVVRLSIYIVEHPDAAKLFRHGQDELSWVSGTQQAV
jgi:hypothetical protein